MCNKLGKVCAMPEGDASSIVKLDILHRSKDSNHYASISSAFPINLENKVRTRTAFEISITSTNQAMEIPTSEILLNAVKRSEHLISFFQNMK
jgi:hypothetical protein